MSPPEVDMDVVVAKIISLIISTVISVLLGLFPCKLYQHFAENIARIQKAVDYSISSMKCFSGGIFLGTCFLHLIPETRKKIEAVMTQSRSYSQYPVAELLTVVGFFGVLFMEHAIRSLYKKLQRLTDRERDYDGGNMFAFSSCRFGGSESDLIRILKNHKCYIRYNIVIGYSFVISSLCSLTITCFHKTTKCRIVITIFYNFFSSHSYNHSIYSKCLNVS